MSKINVFDMQYLIDLFLNNNYHQKLVNSPFW